VSLSGIEPLLDGIDRIERTVDDHTIAIHLPDGSTERVTLGRVTTGN
jgi:hypothetical protein